MYRIVVSILVMVCVLSFNIPEAGAKQWNSEDAVVEADKVWNIEFNVPMNEAQSNGNQFISILDEDGNKVELERTMSGNVMSLSPVISYESGAEYELVIDEKLTSAEGVELKEEIVMPFRIKESMKDGKNTYKSSEFEREVLTLVNKERERIGVSPVELSNPLGYVAHLKAEDMVDHDYFSHESPTFGSPFEMMREFGISFSAAGENIAAGHTSPEMVVEAWMNSPGHKKNILSASYTHLGVGYERNYWVQMFIRR